jgi:hypothetical protein
MFATKKINRRDLMLPDGRVAEDLRLHPLQAELIGRLRIPGCSHEDGKDALLDKYAAHVAAVAEAEPRSGVHPTALSQSAARRAAAVIERQASGDISGPHVVTPPHVGV